MSESKFYDYQPILSRNGTYNFIVGGRGIGKTYGFKYFAIRQYLKKHEQFMYLRRYKLELKSLDGYFDDIVDRFPDWEMRRHGPVAEIRRTGTKQWHTMGFFKALSVSSSEKSVPYPNVHWIHYDEFIVDETGMHRYLNNETTVFNDFYQTIDRWQDRTRVFFTANAVSIMCPYLVEYDLIPQVGKNREWERRYNGFVVANYPNSNEFANAAMKTKFGKFVEGSAYADYAVGNVFADNNDALIIKPPKNKYFLIRIKGRHFPFNVWYLPDYSNNGRAFYIDLKKNGAKTYVIDFEDMGEGKEMIEKSSPVIRWLKNSYMKGSVYFSEPKARNAFSEVFR